jgi:hypothetical protein
MKSYVVIVVAGLAAGVLSACAGDKSAQSEPKVVSAATPGQEAAFEQIKSLDGEWSFKGQQMQGTMVFKTTSNGSVVREIMFPGSGHEMTNMYHLDGPSIVMTHYCAMGNQPHLRATGANPKQIEFHLDSVSNLTKADGGYMGDMTLTIKDKDHVSETWTDTDKGKKGSPHVMELTRVK